jgi:putative SOS response-associated peptidase YedK
MCYSALVKRWTDKNSGLPIMVRDQTDIFERASAADPKKFPPLRERIFPGSYGPVIHHGSGDKLVSELMRYGAYPPHNARRDNLLSPFWSVGFMKHHGFVVLEAFYEWVSVKDVLRAGVVTLAQVKAEFEKQAEERKARILAAGKKYKPTPTELKDPRLRQIVIEFRPDKNDPLLVPTIFSYSEEGEGFDGGRDPGFAIITDVPTPEIENAGHDRCPVILSREEIELWLNPRSMSEEDFLELLNNRKKPIFEHRLAEAA